MDCTMDLFDSATVSVDGRTSAPMHLLIMNKWSECGFGTVSQRVADLRQVL